MKNRFLVVASAALVAMLSFAPAFAQGQVEITGGTLSVAPTVITIAGVTLDGTDRNNVPGTTTVWTATDPTGSGAGWHVNIAATNFVHAVDATKIIAVTGFEAQLVADDIDIVTGNAAPTTSMATSTVLTVAAQSLATAAEDEGMGTYTLLPTFTLDVPLSTYAGSYVSTVTVTIVSAP